MSKFEISITDNQDKFEVDIDCIENIALKMLGYVVNDTTIIEASTLRNLDLNRFSLGFDILFCDDAKIKKLNASYRSLDKPTDVLSFALFADNPDENFSVDGCISLGEVIISLETAKRQAEERKKTFEEEIYFLLSHGILHLLGFDHPDEESLEDILAIQQEMTDFALR